VLLVGVLFLLQYTFNVEIASWWAYLMFLPAIMFFMRARQGYQEDGRISHPVRNSLMVGVLITAVALIFLLGGGDFGRFWPVLVIIVGASFVLRMWE
jgi:UDP-N-acetylmuramyl pentapeptide phosphotransferase/UDP-N-acetylglucosamine-1-phosphate transferase